MLNSSSPSNSGRQIQNNKSVESKNNKEIGGTVKVRRDEEGVAWKLLPPADWQSVDLMSLPRERKREKWGEWDQRQTPHIHWTIIPHWQRTRLHKVPWAPGAPPHSSHPYPPVPPAEISIHHVLLIGEQAEPSNTKCLALIPVCSLSAHSILRRVEFSTLHSHSGGLETRVSGLGNTVSTTSTGFSHTHWPDLAPFHHNRIESSRERQRK